MHSPSPERLNLLVGWLGITIGFVSGLLMGMRFEQETWLGGYSSFKRRLYRLGHVSFFGLGILNLLFYFTAHSAPMYHAGAWLASVCFVIGAASMPLCCLIVAHRPTLKLLFAVPVASLVVAGLTTLVAIVR